MRGRPADGGVIVAAGDRIALIGPSGGGKSTLMRVLAGLYDPQRVQYAVDGEAAAGVRHLGSISTLIPQESEIFEATLRDNLTFGAAYSEEQIERAARLSALDAVAASLPQKWDMPLSERGSTFPGGNANGLRWRAGCSRGNAVRCCCSMSRRALSTGPRKRPCSSDCAKGFPTRASSLRFIA